MSVPKTMSIVLSLVFTACLLAAGCISRPTAPGESGKLIVAVTILPQKTFVEAVCGDLAEVITLVPPGYSPENYEPAPQEMVKFSQAAVYLTIGVPAETAGVLSKLKNMTVVDLAAKVAAAYPDREFSPGQRDPHIWLSPKRVKVMVEAIAATMAGLDPPNAAFYQANAAAFRKELDLVDGKIRAALAGMQDPAFIVLHPAYGYFADDYGLTMQALEEEGKEATPQHLQDMIDLARAKKIKVVFSQAESDSKLPDAFAEDIGGKKVLLDPLSDDYLANLVQMAEAIGGAGS